MRSPINISISKGAHREWSLIISIVCRNFHLKRLFHMKLTTKMIILTSKIKLLHFKYKNKINLQKKKKFILIGTNKMSWETNYKAKSTIPYKTK